MDSSSGEENFDWDSEDEREIENIPATRAITMPREALQVMSAASSSGSKAMDNFVAMGFPEEKVAAVIREVGEENTDSILAALLAHTTTSSPPSSSGSKSVDPYVGMGFDADLVAKVIQENGEENSEAILETLLAYKAIKESPEEQPNIDSDQLSSDCDPSFLDDFSDLDGSENEELIISELDEEGNTLRSLVKMGYPLEEASIALERCGRNAAIGELTDYLCAAQMAKAADALEVKPKIGQNDKKRSFYEFDMKKRKQMKLEKKFLPEDEEILRLPNPMIGFGVPTEAPVLTHRNLPEAAKGPPYFYYENVALAPKGVWQTISRFLYDVEPEFVDSKYFCAAARKRGYVHNLPIENRFPLLPFPPQTIAEALPLTKRWWPSWDPRDKLNCLQTCVASARLTERIRKAVEPYEDEPPMSVQKYVLHECRKWNLVWVGRNKVAPLEPDEVEMLLGFPRNHTRGGGISRTDRFKSLGNSFQVDTVAYHLSVLKDLFPGGISLLSLFSGIGGAEVALHRLGIKLKTVVSVEISEVNRNIQRCWWEQTNQTGILVDIADVQDLNAERLEHLMNTYGAFDLVVGGSPCNNLAGSNRLHRDGLEGKESSLFFDYCRILDLVKCMISEKYSAQR